MTLQSLGVKNLIYVEYREKYSKLQLFQIKNGVFLIGFRGVDVFLIAENLENTPLPVTGDRSLSLYRRSSHPGKILSLVHNIKSW